VQFHDRPFGWVRAARARYHPDKATCRGRTRADEARLKISRRINRKSSCTGQRSSSECAMCNPRRNPDSSAGPVRAFAEGDRLLSHMPHDRARGTVQIIILGIGGRAATARSGCEKLTRQKRKRPPTGAASLRVPSRARQRLPELQRMAMPMDCARRRSWGRSH